MYDETKMKCKSILEFIPPVVELSSPITGITELPMHYRNVSLDHMKGDSSEGSGEALSSSGTDMSTLPETDSRTGVSREAENMGIERKSPEPRLIQLAREIVTVNNYSDASNAYDKRSSLSSAKRPVPVIRGAVLNEHTRDKSIADKEVENVNFNAWEADDQVFNDTDDLWINTETLGLEDLFNEQHIDDTSLIREVQRRSVNKLPSIFTAALLYKTPGKRRFSPENDSPGGRFDKKTMELHNSPTLRMKKLLPISGVTPVRARTKSSAEPATSNVKSRTRKSVGRRRVNTVSEGGQKLLTSMWKKAGLDQRDLERSSLGNGGDNATLQTPRDESGKKSQ